MPTWLKVTLAMVAVLLVVGGVASFLALRRVAASRTAAIDGAAASRHEGEAFGRGKPPQPCVDESLRRLRSGAGFLAEARARHFLEGCLAASNAEPAFCESIPRLHEVAQSGEWTINECRQRDAAEIPRCARLLQEVVKHCSGSLR